MMRCPRCQARLQAALELCGNCDFCLDEVDVLLGNDPVRLGRLTDRAHCLRLMDSRRLEEGLEVFARKFPQIFVGVYFGQLPSGVSMSELTFWLLNRVYLDGDERGRRNEFAVVLVVDPVGKTVGLNVGYALEKVLVQRFLEAVLLELRTPLWHAEYVEAVEMVLSKLERRLKKGAQRVVLGQEFSPPEVEEQILDAVKLDRLREGVGVEESEILDKKEEW